MQWSDDPPLRIGQKVRIYYPDDFYDVGTITEITDNLVTVDFMDWLQRWPVGDLHYVDIGYLRYLVVTTPGEITQTFLGLDDPFLPPSQ